jgi:hypothetical protein
MQARGFLPQNTAATYAAASEPGRNNFGVQEQEPGAGQKPNPVEQRGILTAVARTAEVWLPRSGAGDGPVGKTESNGQPLTGET